jgi:hypothetical protein
MARIEFSVHILNPQKGIVTNEARIDLTLSDAAIGNTQDLERGRQDRSREACTRTRQQ